MNKTGKDYLEKIDIKNIRKQEMIRNTIVWCNKNLFQKYCQSQNYYFTRDVNEILADTTSKAVIRYKDWNCFDDEDEYLKRTYIISEYPQKIQLLTEYYKFHTDIARIFMEPIATLLNKYYDKKRKYEYYRIAKLIEEENKRNPNRPPKGIVGERPSPANSQESQIQEDSPTVTKKMRNLQILKDLSWLNKPQNQTKKNDASQTLQEICKNLGNPEGEASTLLITQSKVEDQQLDKFLAYLNTCSNKEKKISQPIKSTHLKKLSSPHELLIQTIIQQQVKQQQDEQKHRFGSQHTKQHTDLNSFVSKLTKDTQFAYLKNQVDHVAKLQKLQADNPSSTRGDQKTSDCMKNSSKSKTIVQHQPKISTQLFLKDLKKNGTPFIRQTINPIQSPTQLNQQKTQVTNQCKLNLKQISKIFVEDEPTEQELKWKNGSQTHRPISGSQNYFSTRNSPTIIRNTKQETQKQLKPTSSKNIKIAPTTSRKPSQPNIHIRCTSNQEKVININININDQPDYLKSGSQVPIKHKKNCSDGKGEYVCLTDRQPIKGGLATSYQSSPKAKQIKRINSGNQKLAQSTKNSLIQQMITQVAKQKQEPFKK